MAWCNHEYTENLPCLSYTPWMNSRTRKAHLAVTDSHRQDNIGHANKDHTYLIKYTELLCWDYTVRMT